MGCIIEFNEKLRFNFIQNKCKQKLWIDVLLQCSKGNMEYLAFILDVPTEIISQVHQGNHFLEEEHANRLGQLFLTVCGT